MRMARMGSAFRRCSTTYISPRIGACHHHRSRSISASISSQQMSTKADSIAARLNSSGFIRSQGFIEGKWTDAYDGKTFEVCNPATGGVITNVSCMGAKETNDAIASAYDTFLSWSKLTAAERSKKLRKWYELIMEHKDDLGELMTLEQGKPLKEAIGEVSYGASFIEFYAEEAKRIYGDVIPATLPDRRLFVLKQPVGVVGVVGAITPLNFSLAMITLKVAPALASGFTGVVKPAELTLLTTLAAAELSVKVGIPPGIVNVVMGNAADIGDALLASPQVSLQLGGNAPYIIFDDTDLDVALKGTRNLSSVGLSPYRNETHHTWKRSQSHPPRE